MKLLITIVQNTDANGLRDELTRNDLASTKLTSTGGFLREGNTTFLIGVTDDKVEQVKDIIRRTCKQRTKMVPTQSFLESSEGLFAEPVAVSVGGAVTFVLPLEEIVRL